MEHYEILGYLLALRYAQILPDLTAAGLLEQTLKEEYEADQILAELIAQPLVVPRIGSSLATL